MTRDEAREVIRGVVETYIQDALDVGVLDIDIDYYWSAFDTLDNADILEWIPCSERLPNELTQVNVTWINNNPPFYYQKIKGVPQVDTAVYYRGSWYWWDATITDILAEYGEECGAEKIDDDIDIVAWTQLPKPYTD